MFDSSTSCAFYVTVDNTMTRKEAARWQQQQQGGQGDSLDTFKSSFQPSFQQQVASVLQAEKMGIPTVRAAVLRQAPPPPCTTPAERVAAAATRAVSEARVMLGTRSA